MTVYVRVILPLPLRQQFDYILKEPPSQSDALAGCRVRVPFGRKYLTGLIKAVNITPQVATHQLKAVTHLLDDKPLLDHALWQLFHWTSAYYHTPLGEVLATALPSRLLQGEPAVHQETARYTLSERGLSALNNKRVNSPQQKAILNALEQTTLGLTIGEIKLQGHSQRSLNHLMKQQWVTAKHHQPDHANERVLNTDANLRLNKNQQALVHAINATQRFQPFLVHGVTGSGKTEVYLQAVAHTLNQGQQALVLIPEIGLSPQTWQAFKNRLNTTVTIIHSQLPDHERFQAWLSAQSGHTRVVIGTRSALFTPMPDLGLIIIDECHDSAFKQQNGLRYNARDLAVVRAKQAGIPVVLGSATPSLESLYNAQRGIYSYWHLAHRATGAPMPVYQIVDLRRRVLTGGLDASVITRIGEHLKANKQVLVFINRRGYAPTLFCRDCGWTAQCQHCDARMTLHRHRAQLRCHHCGAQRAMDRFCGHCHQQDLIDLGTGTEKLEATLSELFQDYPIIRIDRDRVKSLTALEQQLARAQTGRPALLIGTQMLTKGHHLPQITLVVVVNADHGLLSADFRAVERMGQTLTQVAGRAGRVEEQGSVLIQTHQPEHPLLNQLTTKGYEAFSQSLLSERQVCELPPYSHLALFRAQAPDPQAPLTFLNGVKMCLQKARPASVAIIGPFPAPMERKAGQTRYQLFLSSSDRQSLGHCLNQAMPAIEAIKTGSRLRWSLDKDPYDLF